MPNFRATLALCDGPHSVCGVCFSLHLNKSTSYLSLCLSLNYFCDETSRTWVSSGPETRYYGFWLGLSPNTWVRVPICGKRFQLDYTESWALKNWGVWTVVLEETLESPLDCKEIQPVNPKGNQSWILIVSGECVIFLVLSCHSKNLKQWTSVTTRLQLKFYLASKGKYNLKACRQADPKRKRREKLIFGSSFYVFSSSPWGCPM